MKIDSFKGDFYFLSNMFPCKIEYDGIEFNSVEQAYQYQKTTSTKERSIILQCETPKDAKLKSKRFKFIREDWYEVNLEIMYELLKLKFDIPELKEALELTRGIDLVEVNWWGDRYWGVYNGRGENHLGKLLMKIRDGS